LIVIEEGKDKRKGCEKGSSGRERNGKVEWGGKKGKERIKIEKMDRKKNSPLPVSRCFCRLLTLIIVNGAHHNTD